MCKINQEQGEIDKTIVGLEIEQGEAEAELQVEWLRYSDRLYNTKFSAS